MSRQSQSGDELSRRKRQILSAVIEAHIAMGEPVGSKYLMSAGDIGFSSATIRNEMSELEDLGYLIQPHTSAGRVPTRRGYRFYIESLMQNYALTAAEINQLNDMLRSKAEELDAIMLRASRLVSALSNYATVALKPGDSELTVIRYRFMYLDDHNFVIVAKIKDGSVKTCNFNSPTVFDENRLAKLSKAFNERFTGLPIDTVTLASIMEAESETGAPDGLISMLIKAIYGMLRNKKGDVRISGVDKLLQYPEFSNADRMREIFGLIENKDEMLSLITEADPGKVNVIIGGDTEKLIDNSALVFRTISENGRIVGAIGVLGPSRMNYSKVISTVEYLSSQISGLLGDKKDQQ